MLAYFRRCIYELAERLPMSKEAAEAAVSTQCGFANGAAKKRQKPQSARSATLRMALLTLSLHHADRLNSHASASNDLYALKFFFH